MFFLFQLYKMLKYKKKNSKKGLYQTIKTVVAQKNLNDFSYTSSRLLTIVHL